MRVRGFVVLLVLAGCGGRLEASGEAPAGQERDAGTIRDDGAPFSEASSGADAWSQCTSPDGLEVCGAGACETAPGRGCTPCYNPLRLELCSGMLDNSPCGIPCPSDEVCIEWTDPKSEPETWLCEPWNAGLLFAQNGAANRVRYSDGSLWQGANLPDGGACPATSGAFTLCGGACGPCGAGETCTGQSPLHPFGWCLIAPHEGCALGVRGCMTPGDGCFTYAVQPEAQALANADGLCVPSAECDALAAELPGGGTCTH